MSPPLRPRRLRLTLPLALMALGAGCASSGDASAPAEPEAPGPEVVEPEPEPDAADTHARSEDAAAPPPDVIVEPDVPEEPDASRAPDLPPDPCADKTCSDDVACNGFETCDSVTGECVPGAPPADCCFSDADCPSQAPCVSKGTCKLQTGTCTWSAHLGCDDDDVCNGLETCDPETGECLAGEPLEGCCTVGDDCEDGDPCNGIGNCDQDTSTCFVEAPPLCDDGNPCNGFESCQKGLGCVSVDPLECSDANPCNGVENCDAELGCLVGTPQVCDDGLACNGQEGCDPSSGCQAGTPPQCVDGNPCNGVEACDNVLGCVPGLDPPACDDGDPCNGLEGCEAPEGCQPGTALVCSDDNPCNGLETCSEGVGCVVSSPQVCDDDNACNGLETCLPAEGCVPGAALSCSDGNICNGVESCDLIVGCVGSEPEVCDDGDPCNGLESCEPDAGCQPGTPDATCCTTDFECEDGNPCNGVGACDEAGFCELGPAPACSDGDPCNGLESCQPSSGCAPGTPAVCDDNEPCTKDSCEAGVGCQFEPQAAACDDGDVCTIEDHCDGGECVVEVVDCDDDLPCTSDSCHFAEGCQNEVADGFCVTWEGCEAAWQDPGLLLPPSETGALWLLDDTTGHILRVFADKTIEIAIPSSAIAAASGASSAGFSEIQPTFDDHGHFYFVQESGGDAILRHNVFTGELEHLGTDEDWAAALGVDDIDPIGMAFGPSGILYVSEDDGDMLIAYDPDTGSILPHATGADFAAAYGSGVSLERGIAVDKAGTVFVSTDPPGGVFRVEPSGKVVVHALHAGKAPVAALWVEATGGSFSAEWSCGVDPDWELGTLPYDVDAAGLAAAVAASPQIGPGAVTITGTGGQADPWLLQFSDAFIGEHVPQLSVGEDDLEGEAYGYAIELSSFEDLDAYLTRAPDGGIVAMGDGCEAWIWRLSSDGSASTTLISDNDFAELVGDDVDGDAGMAYDANGVLHVVEIDHGHVLRYTDEEGPSIWLDGAAISEFLGIAPWFSNGVAFEHPPWCGD